MKILSFAIKKAMRRVTEGNGKYGNEASASSFRCPAPSLVPSLSEEQKICDAMRNFKNDDKIELNYRIKIN